MFGISLNQIDQVDGVSIRSSGAGQPLVVFPGMEGSGESCLQVIAKVSQVVRDASCPVTLVLVDYAAENHDSFDALAGTILKLLERNMGDTPLFIWGQSFGNLLAIRAAKSKILNVTQLFLVSAFDSLPSLTISTENFAGKWTPALIYRQTIKPVGRYIFGPCGNQRDHPFFDALQRAPGMVFARRTNWLHNRSFRDEFMSISQPANIWLGAKDRLIDLDRQCEFFGKVSQRSRYTLRMLPDCGHVVLPSDSVERLGEEAGSVMRSLAMEGTV
jgi:pimeloyl-ACP methyl ester carboxylesterase